MQCKEFVSDDVFTCLELRRNFDGPGTVVSDQLIGGPEPLRIGRVVDPAALRNLHEFEIQRVDFGARAVARRNVVDDRAMVTLRKWLIDHPPFDGNDTTCNGRCAYV